MIAEKLSVACAFGSVATSGATSHATTPTKTAFARMGSAVDEKNGAKATMPLSRTMASVIALRNVGQSCIVLSLLRSPCAETVARVS